MNAVLRKRLRLLLHQPMHLLLSWTPQPSISLAPLCRFTRTSRPSYRYGWSLEKGVPHTSLFASLKNISIPCSYKQAQMHDCWNKAMKEELDVVVENHTWWDIVTCPSDIRPVGCKWVYPVKLKSNGILERYKARLVALGNNQNVYGCENDYGRYHACHFCFLILANVLDGCEKCFSTWRSWWSCRYVSSIGYFRLKTIDVCRLRNSLWAKAGTLCLVCQVSQHYSQSSFKQSRFHPSIFLRHTFVGVTILLVYVDNIIILGCDSLGLKKLQYLLHSSLLMKDLGQLNYFLGLEVHQSKRSFHWST